MTDEELIEFVEMQSEAAMQTGVVLRILRQKIIQLEEKVANLEKFRTTFGSF